MSPRTTAAGRRRLSRTPGYARQDRRELYEAIAAVALIVVATAIVIWGMRPGGIGDRQPRAVLLAIILAVVLAISVRLLVGPGRPLWDRPLLGWVIALGITLLIGVVATLAYPGGIVLEIEGDPNGPPTVPDPLEPPPLEVPPPEGEVPPDVEGPPPGGEPPPAP